MLKITNVIKKQGHLFPFEDNWWHNQHKFKSFSFLHFKTVFYTQKDEYFHLAQDSPNNNMNKFLVISIYLQTLLVSTNEL